MKTLILSFLFLFTLLFSCKTEKDKSNGNLVSTLEAFNERLTTIEPGDSIVLAKGIWKDTELLFEANGTVEKPITLTVEEKGKVILEGQSNLRIAGNHLIIKGLVFKNGYTPTNSVISFRKSREEMANNSRLTECVIDNYNNPERQVQDKRTWVLP